MGLLLFLALPYEQEIVAADHAIPKAVLELMSLSKYVTLWMVADYLQIFGLLQVISGSIAIKLQFFSREVSTYTHLIGDPGAPLRQSDVVTWLMSPESGAPFMAALNHSLRRVYGIPAAHELQASLATCFLSLAERVPAQMMRIIEDASPIFKQDAADVMVMVRAVFWKHVEGGPPGRPRIPGQNLGCWNCARDLVMGTVILDCWTRGTERWCPYCAPACSSRNYAMVHATVRLASISRSRAISTRRVCGLIENTDLQ